jgi:hypothetical protein
MLVHEMDAVRCREWAIFPLLARLDEKTGYVVFTAVHVPLYLLLFWGLYGENGFNRSVIMGLNVFFIIHVLLHLLFLRHPRNPFTSLFSWAIILGAGIGGLLDLVNA